ncbi:hypothetical protein FB451DRAFT_1195151 [Mycena latifolia]|nr:hypothetical protein FB451DRAFT_1195151 [Mycena latifolia]
MSSALRRLLSVLQDLGLHSWNIEIAQSREARRDPACEQRDVRRCCGEEAQARDAWYGYREILDVPGKRGRFREGQRQGYIVRGEGRDGLEGPEYRRDVGCAVVGRGWGEGDREMRDVGFGLEDGRDVRCRSGNGGDSSGDVYRKVADRAGRKRARFEDEGRQLGMPAHAAHHVGQIVVRTFGNRDGFLLQGDEVTAHSLFEIALEAFTEMDIHQSRADCMLHLGDIAKQSGDLIKAVELWKHARPLFEQSLQTKEVAKIDTRLAAVDVDLLWQHEKSLQYLRTLNAPTTLLQTGIDQLNIEVDGNGRVPNVRLHWAEEQDGLKMGPKKMAARKFFREVVYKEAIPKFLEIMKEIGQGQGWGLAEVKQRFSNELWDEFLFGDSLK